MYDLPELGISSFLCGTFPIPHASTFKQTPRAPLPDPASSPQRRDYTTTPPSSLCELRPTVSCRFMQNWSLTIDRVAFQLGPANIRMVVMVIVCIRTLNIDEADVGIGG